MMNPGVPTAHLPELWPRKRQSYLMVSQATERYRRRVLLLDYLMPLLGSEVCYAKPG